MLIIYFQYIYIYILIYNLAMQWKSNSFIASFATQLIETIQYSTDGICRGLRHSNLKSNLLDYDL